MYTVNEWKKYNELFIIIEKVNKKDKIWYSNNIEKKQFGKTGFSHIPKEKFMLFLVFYKK